ncbi:bifunctional folylpolyglutamate synthase/dihydrofolate synthase [bacterium]|nr:MAG: bifunctional folylpolyglutamate synthase/dihydrofolate synthase [bacterium]
MRFNTFADVWSYLSEIPNFQKQGISGYAPGLVAIQTFCDKIGNPEKRIKTIHVAGTNGKGTVTAMLSAILQTQGYKTGLYTSPHLLELNERFKINGVNCSNQDLVNFFQLFEHLILEQQLTYFELLTAFAFWHFDKEQVEIAIIEVGLGGRLDATNIISPLCSIITSIGFDHQAILGDTLEKIAIEKAGIIKHKTPVIVGSLPEQAKCVIQDIATNLNAPFYSLDEHVFEIISNYQFKTPLIGSASIELDFIGLINIKNALVSILALKQISKIFSVSSQSIKKGLKHVRQLSGIKGRFEKLIESRNWFFDGAHNEEAFYWLKQNIKTIANPRDCIIVCTFMGDKDYDILLKAYSEFKAVYFYQINSPRAVEWETVHSINKNVQLLHEDSFSKELSKFVDDVVIFTGSFYFYSIIDSRIRQH